MNLTKMTYRESDVNFALVDVMASVGDRRGVVKACPNHIMS